MALSIVSASVDAVRPTLTSHDLPLANMSIFILFVIYTACYVTAEYDYDSYKSQREKIIEEEAILSVGGNAVLSTAEESVNNCLMGHKFKEADYSFENPQYLNFSHHYFTYKNKIRDSKVFEIIKAMPKGAALHVHDMALMGPDYIVNITYLDHLYVCFDRDQVRFKFSNKLPINGCYYSWQLMSEARSSSEDSKKFDEDLRKNFTIVTNDPTKLNPDINEIWQQFSNYFVTVVPLLTYRPVWEQYFYDALKEFRNDKVMYIEFRSVLPPLYELDGTTFDEVVTAKAYKKSILTFMKDYPDFIGAKLIYAPSRFVDEEKVEAYISIARDIKHNVPEIFAGFDLVGQEDKGEPLVEFLPILLEGSKDLKYFFHAGETNWYGTTTDENLIDAILLGAKRLGHAYALTKHPVLIKYVMEKRIALEVNVISNNVLALVRDVRNHPLATFLAKGLPVVLSSDDPGIWEADPISHDFYVAFQGVASKSADLKLLKTLALNSLKFSALSKAQKKRAIEYFNIEWNQFITNFICSF